MNPVPVVKRKIKLNTFSFDGQRQMSEEKSETKTTEEKSQQSEKHDTQRSFVEAHQKGGQHVVIKTVEKKSSWAPSVQVAKNSSTGKIYSFEEEVDKEGEKSWSPVFREVKFSSDGEKQVLEKKTVIKTVREKTLAPTIREVKYSFDGERQTFEEEIGAKTTESISQSSAADKEIEDIASHEEDTPSSSTLQEKEKSKWKKVYRSSREVIVQPQISFEVEECSDSSESTKIKPIKIRKIQTKQSISRDQYESGQSDNRDEFETEEKIPLLTTSKHGIRYSQTSREDPYNKSSESSGFRIGTFVHISNAVAREIKAWTLFGLLTLCYILFIVQPQAEPKMHYISVSKGSPFSTTFNNSGTPSFLFLRISGAFLQFDANISTQNVSVFVSTSENPNHHVSKIITLPVYNEQSIYKAPVSNKFFEMDLPAINESKYYFKIMSSTFYSIPLSVKFTVLTRYLYSQVALAFFICLCFYLVIIFKLLHRTLAAMASTIGVLTILSFLNERFSVEDLVMWVDAKNVFLLVGLMIIVAVLSDTGIFDFLALYIFKCGKKNPWTLITILILTSGILSALFDNVTTILLLSPVVFRLCEMANLNLKIILMIEIVFSNIGGAATAIGDYPNVKIVRDERILSQITPATFTLHLLVGIIFVFTIAYLVLFAWYKRRPQWLYNEQGGVKALKLELAIWQRLSNSLVPYSKEEDVVYTLMEQKIDGINVLIEKQQFSKWSDSSIVQDEIPQYKVTKPWLLIKSGIVLLITLLMYFITDSHVTVVGLGWIALCGATLLLILADIRDIGSLFLRIDWSTIIFFGSLFILVQALSHLGLFQFVGDVTELIIRQAPANFRLLLAIVVILWASAILSTFLNNIPFTISMIPIIIRISDNDYQNLPLLPLVMALAFGACLGGNGSLFAASANIVAVGLGDQHGYEIMFKDFFKFGFPMTLLTTFVAMIYLVVCHGAFGWNY